MGNYRLTDKPDDEKKKLELKENDSRKYGRWKLEDGKNSSWLDMSFA